MVNICQFSDTAVLVFQVSTANNGEVRPTSLMTVRIKLEKPDIALVEDVSTMETSSIILHVREIRY